MTGFDPDAPGGAAHAEQAAAWLYDALGVQLPDGLLGLALTHRSFAYENGGLPTNERLEFLGDSVLGLVVTDELYRSQPDLPEGQLAKLRASVVNMTSLARVARRLGRGGIGPHLLLGRGEETTGGRDKDSILADALEALIGAVHLGRGLEAAGDLVHRLFDPLPRWIAPNSASSASARIESFSRPPVVSSPRPSSRCGPIPRFPSRRATPASEVMLTTEARSLAS